jgi:hypothetical protein
MTPTDYSGLRKGFGGARFGAAAFPFVIFAQAGLVFLHLRFDFVESLFADGAQMFVAGGSVKRTRGQGQIQSECVFFGAGNFRKYSVQQDQIGLVSFQKRIQFGDGAFQLLFNGIVAFDIFETDGEFHKRTCRIFEG